MPNGYRYQRVRRELRANQAADANELGVAVHVRAKRARQTLERQAWRNWIDYQRTWKSYRRTQYRVRPIASYESVEAPDDEGASRRG